VLCDITLKMIEGELYQLTKNGDTEINEEEHFDIIRRKTAYLFAGSAKIGGMVGTITPTQEQALWDYGFNLGIAFQLVDDLLDYKGDAQTLGKNVGDDLAEGKPTLPLIYAMREGTAEQAALVRQAIQKGGIEDLESIRAAVEASGALDYTARQARDYAARAIACLEVLPASEYRDALVELSEFAVARTH
jgi:octaprenyl-diphosphate synthase